MTAHSSHKMKPNGTAMKWNEIKSNQMAQPGMV
eukprot:CAMPEP_0198117502 /NCGR_PEP_ID=MMETSP1442-20131203/18330_1 /TAXON_ID= /ORGANISM="Craspedostauros australis, Strain CCMP3328" /LENGTH=32 /DNA_ID= /DNA_START= /DNA_END= /DNA_ORIENTATION=